MLASKVGPVPHRLHGSVPEGDGCEEVCGDKTEASVGEEDEGGKGVDQGVGHPPTPHPPVPTGCTAAATPHEPFAPEEHHDPDDGEEGEHGL